eukprot:gene27894-34677_t
MPPATVKTFTSSELLSPFKLGDLLLSNRVVLAPLTRGRAGVSRVPNDLMVQYYEQRSSAGLIISEATAISEQGYGWYGAPGCYNEKHAIAWKKVTSAIHARGGKIFLQLWHMGRQSHPTFHTTNEMVFATDEKVPGTGTIRNANHDRVPYEAPRALRTEEIPGIVQQYKTSAEFAKQAGFDGVEFHGANGYLIDGFLQSVSNTRTDKYGGSFENRYRFLGEAIAAVSEVFPPSRIGVRLSPNGGFSGMGSADNDQMFLFVARQLQPLGLAYLHVMDGLGFGEHKKCRNLTLFDMKANFRGLVMGNINYTRDTAEGAIHSGAADMIAFGRPYISNPDLVERYRNNWPLAAAAPYSDWYETDNGAKGYSDFPAYKPDEEVQTA